MSQPITVSMDGTLLNWLKQVGDTVNSGDVIAEIEADKATVEVEAPGSGALLEMRAQPGDEIKEGAVIGIIGAAGEASQTTRETPKPAAASPPAAEAPPPAAPAETDAEAPPQPVTTEGAEPTEGAEENGHLPDGVRASPIARNIAEERGLDLRSIKGTGPGGRITRADVENFKPSAAPAKVASGVGKATMGEYTRQPPTGPDVEVVDIGTIRARIAAVTIESNLTIPTFFVTVDADTEPLLALRKQLNDSLPEGATKISVNDMIVKATALTLRQYPNLNSHFYGDKIARHKKINIAIAVALSQGGVLYVVARDADKVALSTLADQNKAMIARAREGKVKPDDISGATFSVSNLGPYDVEHFTAIINPPQAGVLAVGTSTKVPVVKEDGSLGVGNRMKITISVDHRVSDGAEAALFMQALKQMIENPLRMLM